MPNSKHSTLRSRITLAFALSLFAFIIWIIHEANIGRDNILFQFVRATPYGDKIGHFFIAGFLSLAANYTLRYRCWQFKKLRVPYGSFIIFALFMFEEASQGFLATRSLDIWDAIANSAGILAFTAIQAERYLATRSSQ